VFGIILMRWHSSMRWECLNIMLDPQKVSFWRPLRMAFLAKNGNTATQAMEKNCQKLGPRLNGSSFARLDRFSKGTKLFCCNKRGRWKIESFVAFSDWDLLIWTLELLEPSSSRFDQNPFYFGLFFLFFPPVSVFRIQLCLPLCMTIHFSVRFSAMF